MSAPHVSILMPVYNGGRFLSEAVDSVIGQTARDFELLIIDDGSTDDSAAQAASFSDPRIRLLKNEKNLGLVKTLNRGLTEARGEWIARCDADDAWLPARLALQLALCRQHPEIALVGSNAVLVDENGKFRGQFRTAATHELLCWDLCFRNPFMHSSVLFHRATALEEFSGYKEIPAAEDYDLWSRIAAHHRIASVPQALVRYRLHESSVMAKENAQGRQKSFSYLKDIMQTNLEKFAGFSPASESLQAQLKAWLEPAKDLESLEKFWRIYDTTWREYRKKHRAASFASRVVGEHVLSMLYRQRRLSRASALACLRSLSAEQLLALPWLRAMATMILPSA